MNRFTRSLAGIAASAGKAFACFPAAMASALVIALSASWLVQLDAIPYSKPYQSLQLAFLLAAGLGLAATGIGASRRQAPLRFFGLQAAALAIGLALFFLLKAPPGNIPAITVARIVAATAVLLLVFLLLISRAGTGSSYNQAAFMTLKSAMIALLYGLVILLGLYFIAFTIQSLLYTDMSRKVYQHIAIWSAFLGFAFFLGYFPDFAHDVSDPQLETAQKQPRFAEVLFLYVLIPLMSVLTAVLLAWAAQILAVRTWPAFAQLASILSAYALAGIWLFIMVGESDQPIARFYRRAFPPALLVLLAFEAYALVARIREQGVKTPEYSVLLIWLFALAAGLLFLRGRAWRSHLTAVAGIILLTVAVLPLIGYQDATVFAQTQRLRTVLERNQMLAGDQVQPAPATISEADKAAVTDATAYLLRNEDVRKAGWFENSITSMTDFSRVFGFQQTYQPGRDGPAINEPRTIFLNLPQGSFNISGYQLALRPGEGSSGRRLEARGQRGLYSFSDNIYERGNRPGLAVTLDGRDLLQVDLQPFLEGLAAKYPGVVNKEGGGDFPIEDMILRTGQDGLRLMFVFNFVEIVRQEAGGNRYQIGLHSIYIGEG